MKPFRYSLLLVVYVLFCGLTVKAQSQSYFVVVGAFAKESNAKKFSGFSRSRFFQSAYELNSARNLFYVYVIKTTSKKEAFDQVRLLQKEEVFRDSWVFNGALGITQPAVIEQEQPVANPEPPTNPPESIPTEVISPVTETKPDTTTVVAEAIPPVVEVKPNRVVKGKLFKFNILTPTGEAYAGYVHHVDFKRGRDLASYSSNDFSDVPKPVEEPMTFVCGIFGYKEITQLVDYENPSLTEGAVEGEERAWVIPFNLERLEKGDVSVMYDVSFYKDAVIMLPRSQEELDELVNLMNANTAYKIKIHGHCNGNSDRKIIAIGKTRNYFEMKGADEQNGSAKELTKLRAEAVRDYLIDNGIEKSRMEIMTWGGTNMLVAETSASAKLNDRIEIEILEDTTK
jgi:outer membrane protein OmpA-like peptidoglycan-associated protein